MLKNVLVNGVCVIMMFSQWMIHVEAKGNPPEKNPVITDKSNDGNSVNWEHKYKLGLEKNAVQLDNHKDSLHNKTEYQLLSTNSSGYNTLNRGF